MAARASAGNRVERGREIQGKSLCVHMIGVTACEKGNRPRTGYIHTESSRRADKKYMRKVHEERIRFVTRARRKEKSVRLSCRAPGLSCSPTERPAESVKRDVVLACRLFRSSGA